MKALLVVAALTVSSLAMAEGGGDRTFARMDTAKKNAMEAYRATQMRADQTPVAKSKAKSADQAKN
jgi:hypothetical protein